LALRRFLYAFADHHPAGGGSRVVIANCVWIKGAFRTETADPHTQLVISDSRSAGRLA
jgi:hypothetical protein